MATRRQGREWALQMLFQADLNPGLDIDAAIPSLLTERRELASHVLDRIKLLDALRQWAKAEEADDDRELVNARSARDAAIAAATN